MPQSDPYRVVVWGPGGLGRVAIRETVRHPEFVLAGVRAYANDKQGVDAGRLAGIDDVGVAATTDLRDAVAIDCDCVLHLARDRGRYEALDEILALLRAGRDVITVHPFHHVHAMDVTAAPAGAAVALAEACEEGGSTFHATGIHPEMICDRLAATLTGLCIEVESIKVYENWDMSQFDASTLSVIGYGRSAAQMEANPAVAQMTDNYCLQNLHGLAGVLGLELGRTASTHDYAATPRDLRFPSMDVPAGTVGRLTHTWHGYREGDDDRPFVTLEVNWMMGRAEMVPAGMDPDHYYGVEIEGTPAITMAIGIRSSLAGPSGPLDPADSSTEPGYWAVIATVLQAVPRVRAAAPGILGPVTPELHWTPRLRDLATAPNAQNEDAERAGVRRLA